jgi:hypothetical protein
MLADLSLERDGGVASEGAASDAGWRPRTELPDGPGPEGGLARDVIRAAIRRVMAPIRSCFEAELRHDPAFKAQGVGVRPVPRPDGSLDFELQGSTGRARLDRCLRRAAQRMHLPRNDQPPQVQYPFLFQADGTAGVVLLDE